MPCPLLTWRRACGTPRTEGISNRLIVLFCTFHRISSIMLLRSSGIKPCRVYGSIRFSDKSAWIIIVQDKWIVVIQSATKVSWIASICLWMAYISESCSSSPRFSKEIFLARLIKSSSSACMDSKLAFSGDHHLTGPLSVAVTLLLSDSLSSR